MEFKELQQKQDILGSGYIPHEKRSTDYLYSSVNSPVELPEVCFSANTKQLLQGDKGYCWAFTVVNVRNRQEAVDEQEKYSVEYEIRKTKSTHGNPDTQGETADNAFKTPVKYGLMLEEQLEYTMSYPTQEPSLEMDSEASKHKALSYLKCSTLQEIKQAIFQHQAVGLGCMVMESWYKLNTPDKNGNYVVELPWSSFLGGHLMTLDGYDDNVVVYNKKGQEFKGAFHVSNTWKDWGDSNGGAWLPYAWLQYRTDLGMTFWDGAWTFVDKIENSTGATLRKIQFQINNKNYTINGYNATMDTPPIIINGRTLMPIRFVAESLGLNVSWDEALRKVTLFDEKTTISFFIGQYAAYVNGREVVMDVPAQIINERTHIPLRFVAENLNCKVTWEDLGDIVTIIK